MASTIADIQAKIHRILASLIPEGSRVAIFDFPNHGNVGDSAIWLGEEAFLKRHRCRIVHCDDCYSDVQHLPKLSSDVVILLHGGGNFGDLYPRHQRSRERVISFYEKNKVVQLPQTVYFSNGTAEEKCWSVLNRHPDFHLLVRDHQSAERAQSHTEHPVHLCPDMAFCMTKLPNAAAKRYSTLGLLRTDKETRMPAQHPTHLFTQVDWLDEPAWIERTVGLMFKMHRRMGLRTTEPGRSICNLAATHRLRRGCQILSSAELVITDRLHAHILCTLLNIPHIVIDNNYGKLRSFLTAWDYNSNNLFSDASSLDDALQIAEQRKA